jgi:uncharacterized protein YbjT (DUF2867 family)
MALRNLLITGATGKQGGAVLSALQRSQSTSPFNIFALTRNAKSASAQKLASKPNISLVEGNLDDVPAIFRQLPQSVHGVFSIQVPLKPKVEEQQGKALVDSAASHGVKHFIYTSAERGGPVNSDRDGTVVAHFRSKFNIENHLKSVASQHAGMNWTIIRPVAFMENLSNDFLGRAFATMWRQNGMDRKLQLVSSVDIGVLAAEAFKNEQEYAGKAISLATDELSPREAEQIFKAVFGKDMPRTYDFLGRTIKWAAHEQLGVMFKWFVDVGFGANPKEFTTRYPEMRGFEPWLREQSQFR